MGLEDYLDILRKKEKIAIPIKKMSYHRNNYKWNEKRKSN